MKKSSGASYAAASTVSRCSPPSLVSEWLDEVNDVGTTAMCPRCGIDSVIGAASGFPISAEFLGAMRGYWFAA
jgi:hypothetical protein